MGFRHRVMFLAVLLPVAPAFAVSPPAEDSRLNRPDRNYAVRLDAEIGFLAPVSHVIQFGKEGTLFDYVDDGGQDLLFPVARFTAGIDIGKRETFLLLYQPLDLRTSVILDTDLKVGTVEFPSQTPLELRYGFSFWRGTWLHELAPNPNTEFALGLGLQIRDADISFTSTDGALRSVERDVGPVPLLATRFRTPMSAHTWFGAEASGIWAPVKYLNGADVDVEGAILDSSVRAGLDLGSGTDLFLNVRYLAGGAAGTSKNPESGDGYTRNWLHFATVSIGASLR